MSQSIELKDSTILFKPALHTWEKEGTHFFLDPESPNWIAVESPAAQILDWIDNKKTFSEIVQFYAAEMKTDLAKAWLHIFNFVKEAMARGIVATEPFQFEPYQGRSAYLQPQELKEFWIHLTQTCNLSCTHCLVVSSPQGAMGSDTDFYLQAIQQAKELGVQRFYFTGGEPFVRADIFELIRAVTKTHSCELVILTNATLFNGERLEKLKDVDRSKVKFQVSLDGTTPQTNDAIRGAGVFEKASQGLKQLNALGFETSLTAVVTKTNLKELEQLPALAKQLGAKSVHLMWLHKRGRALGFADLMHDNQETQNVQLLELVRKVQNSANALGILFDNWESIKFRVNGHSGIKYDLGNLCWESLCLYMDKQLYPSAAMAGHPDLKLGLFNGQNLKSLWLESPLAQQIRSASLIQKDNITRDPFRYLTGGGDIEHSYFFSNNGKNGSFIADDPYYNLYIEMVKDVMLDLARNKQSLLNHKTGFNSPIILHAMGDDAITCSEDAQTWLDSKGLPVVRLLHSNCVLSFDVEKPYKAIQKFYGQAAEKPQAELCCPVKYDNAEISHIPKEVIDRFYGCGSPVSMAGIKSGETILDLGSGAGIDCFIAAKKAGPEGKVIGVDMTRQMLEAANQSKTTVAENLGYDIVEFKKGYLEKIPVQDHTIDLVTSNCVINLSPDKKKVFAEIWRILKDHGRLVVADIVSEKSVPVSMQAHQELWGECISGSLSEEEFIRQLESSGFYGIQLLKKMFWKEVEGIAFYSITVRGYKFEKKAGCKFIGQKAIYLGPHKAVTDEEGHLFPRGETIEICTDTAAKLKALPYRDQFTVIEPRKIPAFQIASLDLESQASLAGSQEGCCTTSGCC